MSYKLTPLAKKHIKQIWTYTHKKWGETQADKYTNAIKKCLSYIAKNPSKGRSRDEVSSGLKSHKVEHHHIFYFIAKNEIEVVGILHKQMDPLRHI